MRYSDNQAINWQGDEASAENAAIATIVAIRPDGVAVVDFANNPNGPVPARSAVSSPPSGPPASYLGAKVLVTFENRDLALPVIIGVVHDSLFPTVETELPIEAPPDEVVLDGEKISLDAKEQITLKCGQSAIILKKDGRVVVKGIEITNRALRSNKIKGGTVRIN